MILGDHGPTTEMNEDLKALGMEHLLEAAGTGKAKKAGTENQAAPRQEVPVRGEDEESEAEDEVVEDDEIEIEDEVEEGEVPPQFKKGYKKGDKGKGKGDDDDADGDSDDDDDADDDDSGKGGKSGCAEDEDEDIDEDDEDEIEVDEDLDIDEDEDEDEDEDPKVEAAWAVVEAFEERLRAVQEGDDDARPEYDDLVGVIEAYEYITEAKKEKRKNYVRTATGQRKTKTSAQRQAGRRAGKFLSKGKALRGVGKLHLKKSKKLAARTGRTKHVKAGKKVAVTKGMKMTRRLGADEEPEGTPISELVQHLADLREAVTATAPEIEEIEEETGHDSNELIEGLKAIHDTAVTFYERIASELQEAEEIEEDDARVTMGRFLESIADDAHGVATNIAEDEEIDLEDAAGDLENLAADLNDAIEAMKEIE